MKQAIIRSTWMGGYGYRLDCSPYLGGALEMKVLLEKLPLRKDLLHTLTAGFDGGLYNGPKFSRTWVESPEYGVPFVGGSAMLYADLSDLPLLSNKQAYGRQLRHLELQSGMSLISCSGTIGKMVYARPDMAGIWSSQHILKVVADPAKISSGYLYAYLSSKFGIPLIVSGTYGSIIQSLGPNNIKDVPVPRLGDALEREIHLLVEEAAALRTEANAVKAQLINEFEMAAELPRLALTSSPVPFGCSEVLTSKLESRLDTHLFAPTHLEACRNLQLCAFGTETVASLSVDIVEPTRFKRVEVESSSASVGLFGSAAILHADPQASYQVPRLRSLSQYLVDRNTLLIPRSGSLNGIIGTATLPIGDVVGGLVTEDAIRVFTDRPERVGFLFIALSSEYGKRQLKCRAYGSAIPHLDVVQIGRVLVPKFPSALRDKLGVEGFRVGELRTKAIGHEREAVRRLEKALESKNQ